MFMSPSQFVKPTACQSIRHQINRPIAMSSLMTMLMNFGSNIKSAEGVVDLVENMPLLDVASDIQNTFDHVKNPLTYLPLLADGQPLNELNRVIGDAVSAKVYALPPFGGAIEDMVEKIKGGSAELLGLFDMLPWNEAFKVHYSKYYLLTTLTALVESGECSDGCGINMSLFSEIKADVLSDLLEFMDENASGAFETVESMLEPFESSPMLSDLERVVDTIEDDITDILGAWENVVDYKKDAIDCYMYGRCDGIYDMVESFP